MAGGVVVQTLARQSLNEEAVKVALIDPDGTVYPILTKAIEQWNGKVATKPEDPPGPPLAIELVDPAGRPLDEVRLELSDRVRKEELFAFIELPAGLGGKG